MIDGRIPPNDKAAELAVIGAILAGGRETLADISDRVEPSDFYWARCRQGFEAARALDQRGEPIDLVTFKNELRGLRVENIEDFIVDAIEASSTEEHAPHHARLVREKSQLRSLIQSSLATIEEAYAEVGSPTPLIDRAEERVANTRREATGQTSTASELMTGVLESLQERRDNPSAAGISTGIRTLDEKMLMKGGDLVVIAARPSMGKTSLAVNIASNLAENFDTDSAVFSLEVNKGQVAENILAARGLINTEGLRRGALTEGEQARAESIVRDAASTRAQVFVNSKATTLAEIRAEAKRVAAKPGVNLGAVVVDYLQLMVADSGKGRRSDANRQQEISDISRGLKKLAGELGVPLIALSQLNRVVETRENKRPRMADLRESGSIEQDADIIALLYREAYYNPHISHALQSICEVNIAKYRNGATGVLKLSFAKQYLRFTDTHRRDSQ